jgi:hypothetical protein
MFKAHVAELIQRDVHRHIRTHLVKIKTGLRPGSSAKDLIAVVTRWINAQLAADDQQLPHESQLSSFRHHCETLVDSFDLASTGILALDEHDAHSDVDVCHMLTFADRVTEYDNFFRRHIAPKCAPTTLPAEQLVPMVPFVHVPDELYTAWIVDPVSWQTIRGALQRAIRLASPVHTRCIHLFSECQRAANELQPPSYKQVLRAYSAWVVTTHIRPHLPAVAQ